MFMKILAATSCTLALLALGGARAEGAGGDEKEPRVRSRVLPLSSREAVSLSLNHNLDIEVARFQPWIEDQNIFAAMGAWDHVAYASVSGQGNAATSTFSLNGVTKVRTNDVSATVGVRKVLPFGLSYDFSFSNDRSETNVLTSAFNPAWSQNLGGTVTLPLLKGLGTASNTSTLIIARHSRDQSVDGF